MVRGILVWLLIMLVETAHGIVRGLVLVPRIGEEAAARIGWPIGMILVLIVSFVMIRWVDIWDRRRLLALGAVWAVLTLAFEIVIGVLRGFDGPRLLAEVNPLQGGLMLYSAAVMFFAPLIAARLRRQRQ